MATAGKDKDRIFVLVSCTDDKGYIANGRRRKVQRPKAKSLKHLRHIASASLPEPLTNKLVLQLLKPYMMEYFKEES